MVNIFNYLNYRGYLTDHFKYKKKNNKYYSYRLFARKAGINNQGFYIDVVKGRKNLSENALKKMIKGLGLKGAGARYFKYLVYYNQAKADEKEVFLKKLLETKASSQFRTVTGKFVKYYRKWYFPVVREIIAIEGFDGDYAALGTKIFPKINHLQAKEAVKTLKKLNFIEVKNGKWQATGNEKLRPDIEELREYIKILHKHWIIHGVEAVDKFTPDKRYISSLMAAVPPGRIPEISAKFEELKEYILTLSAEPGSRESAGNIYQFNFQLFPRSSR